MTEPHDYARAVSQWLIGDASWASMLKSVESSEDPRGAALTYFDGDEDELDIVLRQVKR